MKNVEFDTKRQELLKLLDEADRVCNEVTDELDKSQDFSATFNKLRQKIDKTRKHCRESLFEIVLIAAFQSGKSTTINAFCDGREVAPRGLAGGGIKTSACIVKIQNTDSEKKNVIIKWRTYEDLMLRLDEFLGAAACQVSSELQDIKDKRDDEKDIRQKERYKKEYDAKIDIKTPEGQSILEEALSFELKNYNDNPSGYSQDKLSLLQFAMIVLTYHKHEKLLQLRGRDTFQLEEVQGYLKFPSEFQKRWKGVFDEYLKVSDKFEIEEVVYAFIEEVTCKINSDNLRKTGTAVVDAPGLFVSRYDTEVAIAAMEKSSAIFFFSDGEKQLDQSSIQSLKSIKDANYQDKVFFGINYKKKPSLIQKEIEGAILAELNRIEFPQTELLYFNAFLALRAMQGEKILSNTLDQGSQQTIINEAKEMCEEDYDEVADAWLDTTEDIVTRVFSKELKKQFLDIKEEQGLCQEIIQVVMTGSGWFETTDKIKDYVVRKKFYSVLVDRGCQPIIENLKQDVESVLEQTEGNAQKRKEEAEAEWSDAKEKLKYFYNESEEILKIHIKESWDSVLAKDFWERALIYSVEYMSKIAARKIADEANALGVLKDSFLTKPTNFLIAVANFVSPLINSATESLDYNFKKTEFRKFIADKFKVDTSLATNFRQIERLEELQEKCERIIRSELESQLNIKALGWFNSLKEGGNKTYQLIRTNIITLCKEIRDKWKDIKLDENTYLKGLDVNIPKFTGNVMEDIKSSIDDSGAVSSAALAGVIDKAWEDVSGFALSFAALLAVDFLIPGLGTILFTISVLLAQLVTRLSSQREYEKEMADKISDKLKEKLNQDRLNIESKIQEKLSIIRLFYQETTKNKLTGIEKSLNQRIEKAKVNFSKSQEEREKAAEIATKIRTQKVEPLRKKVEEFKQTIPQS